MDDQLISEHILRLSLIAYRLKILEQCMASSWIGEYILDCRNIAKSNIEVHKLNGIALCVLTLIRV